ncbi:MAG TPA: hypothetical protein PLL98_08925 [Bacillota bacterium]|nr:hypothetical protein [Bacillota bacterium]
MKTRNKIFAMLLCLCMAVTLLPATAVAANTGDKPRDITFELAMASDLKGLGLFEGVGTNSDGSTNFELKRVPSRLEALVMLLRLLGKGSEAKVYSGACPFIDVPSWGQPYVAYAYDNGLTNGISQTKFGMGEASCAMYLTFVLRALGYSDAGGADFTWNDPFTLAANKKIMPEGVDTKEFWRADVVAVSYAALYAAKKGGTQTLSESLVVQGVFTSAQFDEITDERLLLAHTIPELRLEGDWPCPKELLLKKWAETYPYYCRYHGLPTKILTEGVTWKWDGGVHGSDYVEYDAATNSVLMNRVNQSRYFSDDFHYDYEDLFLQCMHETSHLFWQAGSENIMTGFGQWAWEATALVAESMFFAERYNDYNHSNIRRFDCTEFCGWDAVNGVFSDSCKYDRTIANGSATDTFIYLCSVLSDEGEWNYFTKVNGLRIQLFEKTGELKVTLDKYAALLDGAAEGRTIDGMKPSDWFRARAVSNTDGAVGDYLITYPFRSIDNSAAVSFACWNRYVDGQGDKREKAYANQSIEFKAFTPSGALVGSETVQTDDCGIGGTELKLSPGIPDNTAIKVTATTTIGGKTVTASTYTIYDQFWVKPDVKEQMYLILLDADGNIVTDVKAADVKVTGSKSVDTSALSGGVLVLTVATGDTANISIGGSTFTLSQPIGVRVVPVTVR